MDLSFRNLSSWLLAETLIALGYVKRAKLKGLSGEYILSLYFHNPSQQEFEACVKWLIKNKFTFISVKDLESISNGERPFPKGGVLLTVDDGWASNETNIVEVAAKYEIPVAIFISTQPVEEGSYWWSYLSFRRSKNNDRRIEALKKVSNNERLVVVDTFKKQFTLSREAMTIDQVHKISKSFLVTIGGHTHSHPILPNCDYLQLYDELNTSKYKLESWINKEIAFFAYPNGDYTIREIQVLKDCGYRLAFSNVPHYITRQHLDKHFELPRIGLLEGASLAENICRMVGVWHPTIKNIKTMFNWDTSSADKAINYKMKKANLAVVEK